MPAYISILDRSEIELISKFQKANSRKFEKRLSSNVFEVSFFEISSFFKNFLEFKI